MTLEHCLGKRFRACQADGNVLPAEAARRVQAQSLGNPGKQQFIRLEKWEGPDYGNLDAKLYSLDSHPMKDVRSPYTDLNKVKIWLCLCIRKITLALVRRQFGGVRKESWGPCWNSVAMLTEQDDWEVNQGCE